MSQEGNSTKRESIVLPDDIERVEKHGLNLDNERIVNQALRQMAPDTFSNIGDLTSMLRRLDERAKDLIYEQKDSQEIVGQLVQEEHTRRKEQLTNPSRNVKTGQEGAPDPNQEAMAWKQYYREQKESRQAAKEADTFDKRAFEDSQDEMAEPIDAYAESINAQGREIQEFENQRQREYEAKLADDQDIKKYSSIAPADSLEGKIREVQARKRRDEQFIAARNKETKQARAEQSKLARKVDQMKYGANDEWTNQRLDLEKELSEKSKKRQAAHTIGYTRREHEKFGFEKPEEYIQRRKQDQAQKEFAQSTFSEIPSEKHQGYGVLRPEEYSRREYNRQAHEEYARTGKDPRFEDPVNVQEHAPEGNVYKAHLGQFDQHTETLRAFNKDKLADWAKNLDKWKEGKDGLTIEDIRSEFPQEALAAYDTLGYKNMPDEMKPVWRAVGAAWDNHKRKLGLRDGQQEYYNPGVEASTFIKAESKERQAYIREYKAHHQEVVQAQEDVAARMEKIKHSEDPKLLFEYNNLKRYKRELEKQNEYTIDSVHSMEGYKHHSDKLAEMNRAFVAGNLSLGEYLASPVVAGYHGLNVARHSYGMWERNALLENQQKRSGFTRWGMDKAIKLPRFATNAGLVAGGTYGAYVGITTALAPVAPFIWLGIVGYGGYKLATKFLIPAYKKGEQINSKIDKAFGEDVITSMFKKKKKD